jgi:L-asparaginase/Glu-tRNA(Gln) amidotransferase subunit D
VVMLNLAQAISADSLPEATDTLVFMAVMVKSGWKVQKAKRDQRMHN